jgi:hypothetical protein
MALRPGTTKLTIPTIMEPITPIEEWPERVSSMMSDGAESVPVILEVKEEKAEALKPVPEISHITVESVTEAPTTPESDMTDIGETMKSYDKLFESGPEPRSSSQTARPNYDELYEHYYAQYSKPKVKLGPRPRPSLDTQRPSTSGSVPQVHSRPKSSLPPGLRSAARKAAEPRRDKSQDSVRTPNLAIPPPPPIPATPEVPSSPISIAFTARTPASVRSMPVSAYGSHRAGNMTQEKTRLMKALELRKKQQKVQIERQEKIAEQTTAASQAEAEKAEATQVNDTVAQSNDSEMSAIAEPDQSLGKTENKAEIEYEGSSRDDTSSSVGLEDSGMVYSKSQTDTDDLNSAASISSPISAQTQGSSGAPSTRPSSLSEDEIAGQNEACSSEDVQDAQSSDVVDEEESVDSLPTVVPEGRTPIPSLIHTGPYSSEMDQTPVDDSAESITETRRHSQAQRRSKRESMLFVPSGDASPLDDGMYKRRNRESIIMPSIPAMPSSKRQSWYETKPKGQAMLDPIQVSADNSEAEYLSDDSFMEELQSATVHEAKPMSVSKSPITPWFPRKTSDMGSVTSESRPLSQVYSKSLGGSPEQFKRSTSGLWPPQVNFDAVGVAKKVNVSSGISQRIKALAEKSSRELSPPVSDLSIPRATASPSASLRSLRPPR